MEKKGWLYVSIISLVSLFVIQLDAYLLLTIKSLVNNFATGRSDFKIISFLIYFAVASFLLFLQTNKLIFPKVRKLVSFKNLKWAFVILLSVTFIIGLFSQLYFFNQYDLDSDSYYKTINKGRQSSTQLFHIHTSKAVLTKAIDLFFPLMHTNYDGGRFFAEYLPAPFWIYYLVVLPILFIMALLLLLDLHNNLKNNKDRMFFLILFIISSFSVLKSTLDGGLLNPETIFWFSILLGVLFHSKTIKVFLKKSLIYASSGYLFLSLPYLLFERSIINLWVEFFVYLLFVLIILLVYHGIKNKHHTEFILSIIGYVILLLIINILFPVTHLNFTFDLIGDISSNVPAGSTAYLYAPSDADIDSCENVIESNDEYTVCSFSVESDTSLRKIWNEKTKFPPNFHPITVDRVTCVKESEYKITTSFILVEGKVPENFSNSLINVSFIKIPKEEVIGNFNHAYNVKAVGCIPNFSDVLQRSLYIRGMKAYITKEP